MAPRKKSKEYEFERIFAQLILENHEKSGISKKHLCRYSVLKKKDNLIQCVENPQKNSSPKRITLEDALHLAMGLDLELPDLIWKAYKIYTDK